jgi:hypothetical protein
MRLHDWWGRLNAYLLENRTRAREYGVWDCWQLTGGGVLAMTGTDYRAQLPTYATLEEGVAILEAQGGAVAMLTAMFGEAKHVSRAMRGDIVLSDLGEGPAAGICLGVETVTVSPGGMETVPTLKGSAAWTV